MNIKIVMFSALFLTGCAATTDSGMAYIDSYDQTTHAVEQTAMLFVPEHIYIEKLDGQKISAGIYYAGAAIRMLPGQHKMEIRYGSAHKVSQGTIVSFSMAKPQRYFVQSYRIRRDSKSYVQFKVHECGGEYEQRAIQARLQNAEESFQAPCPKL